MLLGPASHFEDHCWLVNIIRVEIMGSRVSPPAQVLAPPLMRPVALDESLDFWGTQNPLHVKCNNNVPHRVIVRLQ